MVKSETSSVFWKTKCWVALLLDSSLKTFLAERELGLRNWVQFALHEEVPVIGNAQPAIVKNLGRKEVKRIMDRIFLALNFPVEMLPEGRILMVKEGLSIEKVRELIEAEKVISCISPHDRDTLSKLQERYGIGIPISDDRLPPQIVMEDGDSIIVLQSKGEKSPLIEIVSGAPEWRMTMTT